MKSEDLINLAITSGEAEAKWMLENGSSEQKLLAQKYLDKLEEIKEFYRRKEEIKNHEC